VITTIISNERYDPTVNITPNTVPVYVFPRLRIRKRKMIRADPYHGAVLIMELLGSVGLHARAVLDSPRKPRCAPKQRPRELPERVEVDIVEDGGCLPCKDLFS
jgi:hypothetical protein